MFWNQRGCSNIVGFEEEELEIMRLKNLFTENILKVEKENMEIIKKEISDTKQLEKKENNPKRITGKTTSVAATKSSVYKRLHRKLSENKKEPEARLPDLETETVCHKARPQCQSSYIHFLNHFQSSLLSSNVQGCDDRPAGKYMPCATPLAPPTQKRSSVLDERIQQNNTRTRLSPNVIVHNIVSEEEPKKLTVQVLPSITIHGTKPNYRTNIPNVLTQVIKKRDYFEGDGIKTTVLPKLSDEERNRISSIKLNSRNSKNSLTNEKSQLSEVIPNKLSTFTQTSCENSVLPDGTTEKERLREMIKDILQDFQLKYQNDPMENFSGVSTIKEQEILSPKNDCELDSFLGNVDSSPRLSSNLIDEKVLKSSAQTQTSQDIPDAEFQNERIKNLVQEVISNLQENATCRLSFINHEQNIDQIIEKVHKEIQTNEDSERTKDDRCFVPKAIQVTLKEEPSVKCEGAKAETLETGQEDSTNNLLGDNVYKPPEGDLISSPLETSSKLESILNCIYERFCVERLEPPTDPILDTSSYKEGTSLVPTREVSVQYNPVSTLTKGTCTSDVIQVDDSQQCSLLSPMTLPEKHVSHAFVQAELLMPRPIPPTTTSTCVQCEQLALIDSYAQTMEYLTIRPPSENSANTSISTTPVSDSMFLDDMLSEGEVFLPCNLRLFSGSDKTSVQNSRNNTDMSGNSDKDNDYSLSEGEIHPKYLQHMHLPSSGDGHINHYASTNPIYPQHSTVLLGRSPGEVNPESRSHSAARQSFYSSSSLSEGEIRSSSTPLSEGEVVFHARPGPSFQPSISHSFSDTWNDSIQNLSFRYPFPSHRTDFSLESDPRAHYHLGVFRDESDRRVSEASLCTVAEEK